MKDQQIWQVVGSSKHTAGLTLNNGFEFMAELKEGPDARTTGDV